MIDTLALIGFGEAGQAFAGGLKPALRAFDRKTQDPALRPGKIADYARAGIDWADEAGGALSGAGAALSLVTADQALPAARAAQALPADAFWFDMNSVSPDTKRLAADAVPGRYVDVAVMAPVHPRRTAVPLLVSGPHAADGAELLRSIGFTAVSVIEGPVGAASAVKMIRSVMVKGIEALSAECVLAADAAGVRDAVIASLDASWTEQGWAERFDYNLDRMMVHGLRRAAEMEEVVATLNALGTGSAMSRGTVERQAAMGRLSIAPPDGLPRKLEVLAPFVRCSPGNDAA